MACCTLCRVCSATISGRLSTFDTVPSETPARLATSRIPDKEPMRVSFLISSIDVRLGVRRIIAYLLTIWLFAFILAFIETFQFAKIFAYVRGDRIDCANATPYF